MCTTEGNHLMPNEFAISSEAMWVTYANEDGESVCEFEYCDEAIPTMYICHNLRRHGSHHVRRGSRRVTWWSHQL